MALLTDPRPIARGGTDAHAHHQRHDRHRRRLATAADVLIDGETIAQIGRDLAAAGVTADETIDAAGKYVIPGGIDVHTHMELPFGGTFAKDTFETGTRAAAFGGTTSIVDFAVQSKGADAARRASTPGTPRPRATPSPTTAST